MGERFKPRIKVDREADAFSVVFKAGEKSASTVRVDDNRALDFNKKGQLLEVEFMGIADAQINSDLPISAGRLGTIRRLYEEATKI